MSCRPLSFMALRPTVSAPRSIPGSYGPPVFGALKDRLDYFWFQGPESFFRRRAEENRSTVFRTNVPPAFPFFLNDPRVVALVDAESFKVLFDTSLVDKRDVLVGPYTPSRAFTGGVRVVVYQDTTDPGHAAAKSFVLDLLRGSARTWTESFLVALNDMLGKIEASLAKDTGPVGFLVPLQQFLFHFLCRSIVGADPKADETIDRIGFALLDNWVALQLLPTQKVGVLPQPLEELLLHSFPLPSLLSKGAYDKLRNFVEKEGQAVVSKATGEYGLTADEAVNNILFILGFNAFGGFSVFLPSLFSTIGSTSSAELRATLRDEVRGVLKRRGDVALSFAAAKEMPLVRSAVYELLRMKPPVPLQYGRARHDFVIQSHDGAFSVAKGELLCGYQPLAMRDPKVFSQPEEFVPTRFVGDVGEEMLRYVYWSNGPETAEPTPENKQCAAKDYVVATSCMLVGEMLRRYDDFECNESMAFTKLVPAS